MFIRQKLNRGGSTTVQIIDKSSGVFRIVKTVGLARNDEQLRDLVIRAEEEFEKITGQNRLHLPDSNDEVFLRQLKSGFRKVMVTGPELVLGKIFDEIGYCQITDSLFRHLVITRLIHPGSKLKTVDYLLHYRGVHTTEDRIYRYMDRFAADHKETAIALTFEHTKKILGGQISISFYDITTLYFEASDEDDLRRLGFSKDGKAQNPQILLALMVGIDGQPLAFEVFEGDMFEGHTLIPVVEAFKARYQLKDLVIVADAGLLSRQNIDELIRLKYPFILGARLKGEAESVKSRILEHDYQKEDTITIQKSAQVRLIINYSEKRAKKDAHTRRQGLLRLEKSIRSGRLTKEKINNRGYNKYLRLKNQVAVEIDYKLFETDSKWNGLKGYVTNAGYTQTEIMDNYKHLWAIEKAFRISKTDLRVRPIYHRLERRIRTHICLAFCSYKIYKELERRLKVKKSPYSVDQAIRALKTIYEAIVVLPHSKSKERILLPLDKIQEHILDAMEIKR